MSEKIKFHLDESVDPDIAVGLSKYGVDVTTTKAEGLLSQSHLNNFSLTTPAYKATITGRGVWCRSNFPNPENWSYHLKPETLSEIKNAVQEIRKQRKDLLAVTTEVFPIPSFANDAANLLKELKTGRGFVVLEGLPIDQYTYEEICTIYWAISTFFGTTLIQNVEGDLLYSVQDKGYSQEAHLSNHKIRGADTGGSLNFHTDSAPAFQGDTPDIFGLLVLQAAKSGGESRLISAQTLHNIILEEHPEYLERLYAPYHFDRRAELNPGELPTFLAPIFTYDNCLSIRYANLYILKGYEASGIPLTPADKEPIDFIQSVLQREELAVVFKLKRGDILFINNRSILHGRTTFEDYPEPERKRHLIRIWLKNTACRQLGPEPLVARRYYSSVALPLSDWLSQ